MMAYMTHTAKIVIHLDNLVHNYQLLCSLAGSSPLGPFMPNPGATSYVQWPNMMPVIKADAYGHGHIPTAVALCGAGASLLASGNMAEAVELREGLAKKGYFPAIVSLLGCIAPEEYELALRYEIIPVVHCMEQLDYLVAVSPVKLHVALKFTTGMGRLGFTEEEVPQLPAKLAALPDVRPVLAVSHLACADMEDGESFTQAQIQTMARILGKLRESYPTITSSICNSAGAVTAKEADAQLGGHVVRPGISLYGVPPLVGTSRESRLPFLPVMEAGAPVIALRRLSQGSGIGYEQTFVASRPTLAAIVCVGYADGYNRLYSNKGSMLIRGKRAPVIGRVSMQMTAIDCTDIPGVQIGDTAYILGGGKNGVTCQEMADWAGTIPYEVFCLLGNSNNKQYLE